MNLHAASTHGHRIYLLEFAIVLKMTDNKTENSSGEMQRLQMIYRENVHIPIIKYP